MAQKNKKQFDVRRHGVGLAIAGLALLFIVLTIPGDGSLHASVGLLSNAHIFYALLAFLMVCGSFFMAGSMYYMLAPRYLKFRPTIMIAVAGGFAGKLLPAGAGGMTLNFLYLRKNRFNRAQAASIVACNNILGFVAHSLLLGVALVVSDSAIPSFGIETNKVVPVLILGLLILAGLFVVRRRLAVSVTRVKSQLHKLFRVYKKQPWRVLLAILFAMVMTLCYSLCLYFSIQAVGSEISFIAALGIYTIGAAAAGLVPTPSGIGAVEAGMIAGLIGIGVAAPTALAAVLLHRLISFWLSFGVGAVALVLARRRRII